MCLSVILSTRKGVIPTIGCFYYGKVRGVWWKADVVDPLPLEAVLDNPVMTSSGGHCSGQIHPTGMHSYHPPVCPLGGGRGWGSGGVSPHAPGRGGVYNPSTHTPWRPLQRVVCILLECILVCNCISQVLQLGLSRQKMWYISAHSQLSQ